MDLKTYYHSLNKADREAYAKRAGTTVRYIECHLLAARKIPRPELMKGLATASKGNVSETDVLRHFYGRK